MSCPPDPDRRRWLQWCGSLLLSPSLAAAAARPLRTLAVFYGIPSLVNGAAGDSARAAAVFAAYDLVVFGDGLEFAQRDGGRHAAGAVEQQRTRDVIAGVRRLNPSAAIFGYVPLGHTQALTDAEIREAVDRWAAMQVHGIFFDEAGYDFGATRPRQNAAVAAARAHDLRVFMNAFEPDDVLARAGGEVRLRQGDLVLIESFAIRNGVVDTSGLWEQRARRAVRYRDEAGVAIAAVTTTVPGTPFRADQYALAHDAALRCELDAFGWGEPWFGAADSLLPVRR